MKLQEQPNMHLTFAKTAKMHKTLLCEQLGCLGVDCLRVVVFLGGGCWAGLAQGGLGLG